MTAPRLQPSNLEIYVIGISLGPLKIGLSKNPVMRLNTLRTASHIPLELIRSVPVQRSEAREIEMHAHWLLRTHHLRGEWFSCSPDEASEAVETAIQEVRTGIARDKREASSPRVAKPSSQAGAWTIKGVPRKTRLAAVHAAQASGQTVAQFVTEAVELLIAERAGNVLKPPHVGRPRPLTSDQLTARILAIVAMQQGVAAHRAATGRAMGRDVLRLGMASLSRHLIAAEGEPPHYAPRIDAKLISKDAD